MIVVIILCSIEVSSQQHLRVMDIREVMSPRGWVFDVVYIFSSYKYIKFISTFDIIKLKFKFV